MKSIVFDSGPIISLTINSLLWVLKELKKDFDGEFYITPAVYGELINKPLTTKKYKLEALQVLPYITDGTLKVYKDPRVEQIAKDIDTVANKAFKIHGNWVRIVHRGEIEAVATAILSKANAIGIDERTTRHLIERPEKIAEHLERKIHARVTINWKNVDWIKEKLKDLHVIRSTELVSIAYEKGILQAPLNKAAQNIMDNPNRAILEGALWGVKLNGCSIKEKEIEKILEMLTS